jgi:hypothetical protein
MATQRPDVTNRFSPSTMTNAFRRAFASMSAPAARTHLARERTKDLVTFESLEQRILLSADLPMASLQTDQVVEASVAAQTDMAPLPTIQFQQRSASGTGSVHTLYLDVDARAIALDATLKIDTDGTLSSLVLLDNASGSVLGSHRIDTDALDVSILGGDADDSLLIDLSSPIVFPAIHVGFDGGEGNDTLRGTGADTEWSITGVNEGTVDSTSFIGVENLRGAAGNRDSFTIFAAGRLSGLLDGGVGGFDVLSLDGGDYASVTYVASGPDSGTIARDDDLLRYAGLEPIFDNVSATDRVIRTSNLTDNARLTDDGTLLTLASTDVVPTFESITFAKPTNSLTIDLGGDLGIPVLSDTDRLEIQALSLGADLIVNGEGGKDEVTISGNLALGSNPLTINAEAIIVNPGVAIAAGDIVLNAVASVGSVGTPDTLPLADVAASIDIDGATLMGNNVSLLASASLVSNVTNPLPAIPAATLVANVSAQIDVRGNTLITATGAFTADAASNVDATILANAATAPVVGEVAIASPVINTTARSGLRGATSVSAAEAVSIHAATNTLVSATADGITAATAVGTTTAVPVVVVTTEAFLDDGASVTDSSSLSIHAEATGALATLSNSTPLGAAVPPTTLATLGIATAAGPQTEAAAIAVTTLTSTTRAYADTTGVLVTTGALTLLAESAFDVDTTANAIPSVNPSNNGFAVAVNFTQIIDEAFIGGSPTITAATASIRTGGGSTLSALSQSGAAGLTEANAGINAGSLALNTNIPSAGPIQGNLSHAFISSGAVVTFTAPTDLEIAAQNTTVTDVSAEPQGAASIAVELGVGRSVALNVSAYTTSATIDAGASLSGVRNLDVTADGDQTQRVTALAGSLAGVDASSQTAAASVTGNASTVIIDVGAAMVVSGAVVARANHKGTSIVRASSDAAAAASDAPSESLALPIALNLANDVASVDLAGSVTAAGAITIAADADVENEVESIAGVQGADPDTTDAGDLVAAEIAFLADRANLSFGGSPRPPTTDPDVDTLSLTELTNNQTQGKAAAIAVNLSTAASRATILGTGSATSTGGTLDVLATSDIDATALASASAVLNLVGVAAGIAVNAQQSDTVASIGGNAAGNGIDVVSEASGDGLHTLTAQAVSGNGTQAVGVSGAVAATLALGTANAIVADGATLTLGADTDLTVSATANISNVADAAPHVDAGTILGVGASVEFNASLFSTLAQIQNAAITGADDVVVTAEGDYLTTADAQAGATAAAGIGAAVAVLISNTTTTADVTNNSTPAAITGSFIVSADHFARASHSADANSNAEELGVGGAVAIGVMQGGARAFLGSDVDVAGSVSVTALTDATMDADAIASSQGVATNDILLPLKLDRVLDEAFAALLPSLEVDPVADVDAAADTLTVTGHGLATGDAVTYSFGDDDEAIGALTDGDTYFVRVVDANTLRLYGTRDNAVDDVNRIDLAPTSNVVDPHTLQPGMPASVGDLIDTSRLGTASGAVGAAAAAAVNVDFNSALAGIIVGANVTANGAVVVTSTLTSDDDAVADGRAVDSTTALGVAAAANISSQSNQAFIGGQVTGTQVEVQALLGGDGVASFNANAISGAGGSDGLGVAGAFAVNLSAPLLPIAPINIPIPALPALPALPTLPAPLPALPPLPTLTLPTLPPIPVPTGGTQGAVIQSGANITLLGGGDLIVRSDYVGDYTATSSATPDAGSEVGVGPSFAANAMTQQSLAEIQDAVITGTAVAGINRSDIRVLASGEYASNADATAGATNSVNVPAAAAMNYNDLNTIARTTNTTGTSVISGDLQVDASHEAEAIHVADTDSGVGGTASIGAAISFGFVLGGAEAASGMQIDVLSGTVSVTAENQSVIDADALTGQSGTQADPAGPVVTEQIEAQIEGLLQLAGQDEIPEDVIRILQRAEAQTADGPIGAAAALAMNLDFSYSTAALSDGSVIQTSNAPLVSARGNMDADALADAQSVDAATGIGVAVAINVDAQRIEGSIGGTVTAPSIEIETVMIGDDVNRFQAVARSGVGADDIGVAGAFALNLSGDPRDILSGTATGGGQHVARIADGSVLNLSAPSDVNVTSLYAGTYFALASATPGDGTLGIGPSVAVNAIQHTALAEIGTAIITGADDVNVLAEGTYTTNTLAVAGAESAGSLPAAVALTAAQNDTIARVRPGPATSVITGNLNVTANHTATTNTLADAESGGADVGFGAAIAAGGPLGGAQADAGANMTVGGDVVVLADTDSVAETNALASQVGTLIGGFTTDEETQRQLKRLAVIAGVDDILYPFVDPHPPLAATFNAETAVDGTTDTIRIDVPHAFDTGDAVVYRNNQDDSNIVGLVDGTRYFVRVDANDPSLVRLYANRADALAGTNALDIEAITDAEDNHTLAAERGFVPGAVNGTEDTIAVSNFAGLADGDAVKYFNEGNDNLQGLVDGRRYFVNVDDSDPTSMSIRLFETRSAAFANDDEDVIDLDPAGMSGLHRIAKVFDAHHDRALSIDPIASVNDADNRLNLVPAGFENGDSFVYSTHGDDTVIGGLTDGTVYFIRYVEVEGVRLGIQLFTTLADADANANAIDLAPAANADVQHSLAPAYAFDPAATVDSAENTIDLAAFDVRSGEAVIYRNNGGNSIGGLVDDAVYYILRLDDGRVVLLNTPNPFDIADLDAAAASGGAHRFERVLIDAPADDNVPDIRMGAAAAIAAGAGRPVSHAAIGAGATIVATNVFVTASMDFDADAEADALAIGGAAAVGLAAAGNYSEGVHIAEIGNAASVTAGTVTLVASGEGDLPFDYRADAASAAANLGGNIAGSIAVNAMRNHTAVRIGDDATVEVDGRLDLLVNQRRDDGNVVDAGGVQSVTRAGEVALGALAAAGAAVAGTITLDGDLNEASIGEGAVVIAPAGVDVRAKTIHDFDNRAVGGSLSLVFAAAVGAGFNYTNTEARAEVAGSVTADGGNLNVIADTDVPYTSQALGLAAGGLIAIAGSAEANVIANTTRAAILGGGTIDADAVLVRARDTSELDTDTGALSASILGAAGASVGVNLMNNTVEAAIGAATVTTDVGGIDVQATSSYDVDALALGLSAAGLVAGVGTFTYNDLANTTSASIRPDASIDAAGSVEVTAVDTSSAHANSGGLAASLGVGVGASIALNTLDNRVEAYSDDADITAATGTLTLDASSANDVDALALAFAAAGIVGGYATVTINESNTETDASVRNGGVIEAPIAIVHARDESSFSASAGGLAASLGVGAGGSLGQNTLSTSVTAGIGGATLTTTSGNVDIQATSSFDVNAFGMGFSIGGLIGGVGTAMINELTTATHAYIDDGAEVASAAEVRVIAADDSNADADAGGMAVGGLVGAGLSFASSKAIGDVQALIDGEDTVVDAVGALTLRATLTPDVSANALGFSVSAFAAASGAVAIAETGGEARAAIQNGATVTAASVSIESTANGSPQSNAGGLAGAVFAAAGVMIAETLAGHSAVAEADGTITTGQLDVTAQASRTGVADVNFAGIAVFTGEVGFEAEHTAGNTEAIIGDAADITVTGGGDVNVAATSNDTVDPHIVDVGVGLFTIGAQATSAVIASNTRAKASGRVSARNVNVASSATKVADATTDIIGISILSLNGVALSGIADKLPDDLPIIVLPPFDTDARATIGGDTEASLGGTADITATGTLSVTANSTNDAQASNLSAGMTLVNVADTAATATAGGSTLMHIDEGASIDVNALVSTATSDNDANARGDYAGASGVNVLLVDIAAHTSHLTAAYLGPAFGQNPGGGARTTLTVGSGGMNLAATSTNDASVGQVTLDPSLVTVEKVKPEANAGGTTRAHVGGGFDINAAGVNVSATSTNDASSQALAFEIGLVDVDQTERSASTTHVTEAFVGPSADLAISGGALTLDAESDNDATIDMITPIDLGAVELNFVKSTADAGGVTRSYVAEGSTLSAAALTADAVANNEASVDRFQFGVSLFSLQEATPVARTTHHVESYVGPRVGTAPNGAAGTITLGGALTLNADSTNEATVGEVNIALSLVGIDLVKPEMNAGGTTRAYIGGDYTIDASAVAGAAESTNTAGSDSVPIKLGLVQVTEVSAEARTTHETEAFVTRGADFTLNGGGIDLGATSSNIAELTRFELGVSLVSVGTFKPWVETAGATRAFVEEGASLTAGGLDLEAAAANTAQLESNVVAVSLVDIGIIRPTVRTTHVVDAYVGPRAGVGPDGGTNGTISLGGALRVVAGQVDNGNRATVDAFSVSVGLVNFDSVRPDVMAGGQTLAHLGGNFSINAGSVEVTASAPENHASSDVFALNVGLVNVGVGGSATPIRVTHETAAYIADAANITVTGGPLAFFAQSTGTASADNFDIQVGLVQVADIESEARVEGSTRSYVGGNARLTAGNASFRARSFGNTAEASMSNVNVGLVDVVDLNPTAVTANVVEAFIAGGAVVTAGSISLTAELDARADADVDTEGFGLVSVASVDPTANAENLVKAFVDGNVTSADLSLSANATRVSDANAAVITIGVVGSAGADAHSNTTGNTQVYFGSTSSVTASGNVTGSAVANNRSNAKATGGGGGVIGVGILESNANLTGGTTAYFNPNAQVLQAGNVELSAVAVNTAKADTTAGTGGVVSVRGSQATARVTPVVEAVVDNGVSMQNVGGSVTLHAESLRAEGDSTAGSYGGGFVDVGAANADTDVTPTVNAFIDTGATLDVGGSVTVEALVRAEPAASFGDTFTPDQATIDNDTIAFTQHGLATGDRVTYGPNGNPAIATADGGTLQAGREYSVIFTGDDTLQLGAIFSASGADTGDALDPENGVDALRDRVRFSVPHGFETGDAVKYTSDGTSISTGLDTSTTYFVRRLDDYTIKLYADRNEALGAGGFADDTFFASAVDEAADTLTVFGSGYAENQAVTYRAAPSPQFRSEAVDVNVSGGTATPTDNNQIYIPSHGFGTGNRVIYRVEPGGTAIGGLTSGTAYFVIVVDGNHIQLAATRDAADPDDGDDDVDVTPIALSPDKNPPASLQQHMLQREAIGGLVDGATYYARNVSGDTFQLAATPGGSPITNLDGEGRIGVHAFARPGLDLTAQSGIHSLRLDLTSAPAGNHLLLGPGGVSLRDIAPPTGDGQSSATAKGGGGGFVAVGNPDADLVLTQNVQAYIAPALLEAGGNVTVRTTSIVNSTAYASNGGGGFVAVGAADSNNDVNHDNRAYIGIDDGSGNIVADGVNIEADGHLSVTTDSRLDVHVRSNSDAGGFVADVDAASRGSLNDETQVVVGSNAHVTARSVALRSQWSHMDFIYHSEADAGGFAGDADARASGSVNPHVTTAIRGGAEVTGFEGVDIRARLDDTTMSQSDVDADFDGLFGDGDDHPDATYDPQTLIDADPTGLIVAGPRLFPVAGVPAIDVTPLQQPSGFDRLALFVDLDAEDGTRDIAWDSNVILLPGPNPTLIVGPDGRIVKAINAGVVGVGSGIGSYVDPDNDGSFRVQDIINDNDRGQALFRSNDEANPDLFTALPNGPLFTFRETYVGVEILNQSGLDMVIGEIEVVNTFLSTPEDEVILEVNDVADFEFDVNHDFKPTLIEISNTLAGLDAAAPDITFAGEVNNPIGMTHVFNARGDILSSLMGGGEFPTPPGLIRTDSFRIEAVLNDIGRNDSQRLRLEIVESNDGPTGADRYRTSDAGGRNYMELRGLLRRGARRQRRYDGLRPGRGTDQVRYVPLDGMSIWNCSTGCSSRPMSPGPTRSKCSKTASSVCRRTPPARRRGRQLSLITSAPRQARCRPSSRAGSGARASPRSKSATCSASLSIRSDASSAVRTSTSSVFPLRPARSSTSSAGRISSATASSASRTSTCSPTGTSR